jgi:hypothetical protein
MSKLNLTGGTLSGALNGYKPLTFLPSVTAQDLILSKPVIFFC